VPEQALDIEIAVDGGAVAGRLSVPDRARALVLFAHGSGSGRHSPRNRAVATSLQHAGLATLLMDLLTDAEERTDMVTSEFRFDIVLLAGRVAAAIDWARAGGTPAAGKIGLFGASTGAAAALIAAATRPYATSAVVSRGGRPDLAGDALRKVRAPSLFIVGSRDDIVLELNRHALARMSCEKELAIVPGATHLFEEPGALETVSTLAASWFTGHGTHGHGTHGTGEGG